MKITILSTVLMAFSSLVMNAQHYEVGTDLQKKQVLIETFVGTRCKWSSEAPDFVKKVEAGMGTDKVNTVNIHCGRKSEPSYDGDYDYRTVEGDQIATMLGGIGGPFPNGAVNRHNWNLDGQYTFGRYQWISQSRRAITENAPVNLWAKAVYDGETRRLSVRVEGYFTSSDIAKQQRLNVLLTENHFTGLQVTQFGYDYQFVHQHMMRSSLTAVEGDLLDGCQPHTYFSKEYVYEVPKEIRQVPVTPSELELVIFVAGNDNRQVMNSITVKPTYQNMTLPLNASIHKDKMGVTDGYQFDFLPVVLSNRCDTELTSATFDVTLNNETVEKTWTGALAAFCEQTISLPIDWSNANAGRNDFKVTLKTLNGQTVNAQPVKGYFNCPLLEVPSQVTLNLYTSADEPDDFSYTLYEKNGQVVKTFGPYKADQAVEEQLQLIPGKTYCFEMGAKWGNGFVPYGSALELCDASGQVLTMVDRVEGFGTRVFFKVKSESVNVKTTWGQNLNCALATFSAGYPSTPSDKNVEAYFAEQKDESTIALKKILPVNGTLVIPANVGVMLSTPEASTFQMTASDKGNATVSATNLLQPTGDEGIEVSRSKTAYILAKKYDDILFHILSDDQRTIAANRAFLEMPVNMNTVSLRMVFDDEQTGLETINTDKKSPIFDLSGRKVLQPVKGGIYIQNGKKFIIK